MSGELQQWGQNTGTTAGLVYGYFGGTALSSGGVRAHISDGTIALTNGATNYVERLYNGTVQTNTTSFTPTLALPMAAVTTSGGVITLVVDWREELGPPLLYPLVAGETLVVDFRYPVGDMRRYGAVGDGSTDNTTRFAAATTALNANGGGDLYVTAGNYMIDADYHTGKSIRLGSNTNLILQAGAVLSAIPNALTSYAIVYINGQSNVTVSGPGQIIGDRTGHIGTTGEWGMGVQIDGSTNVSVRDVKISNCWGDGILVGENALCADVFISNIISDNNRRQGMSIVYAARVSVSDSTFSNTNGTAPSAGIDCEPDPGLTVTDVTVTNCHFEGNVIGMAFGGSGAGAGAKRCRVSSSTFLNNSAYGINLGGADTDDCAITDNTISQSDEASAGIHTSAEYVVIEGNVVVGTFAYGIWVQGFGVETNVGRALVTNNRVLGSSVGYGILCSNLASRSLIEGNRVTTCNQNITASNCNGASIIGNRSDGAANLGFNLVGGSSSALVSLCIHDNIAEGGASHGYFLSDLTASVISGNTAVSNALLGFSLSVVFDTVFEGNLAKGNSQSADNTNDNFSLNACTNVLCQGNIARKGDGANRARFGFTLNSACVGITRRWNDFVGGGQSADIRDFGSTGTMADFSLGAFTVAYSASMTPNPFLGNKATVTATNGIAFAINAPASPAGDGLPANPRMTMTIRNTSGGVLGVATWAAIYKMAAWVQPANGFSRSITFDYDGTNWVESSRTPSDVPN